MNNKDHYSNKEYRKHNENVEGRNLPTWKEKFKSHSRNEPIQEVTNGKNNSDQRNHYRYGFKTNNTTEFPSKNYCNSFYKNDENKIKGKERFLGVSEKNYQAQWFKKKNELSSKYSMYNYDNRKNFTDKRECDFIIPKCSNHVIMNVHKDEMEPLSLTCFRTIGKRNRVNERNHLESNKKEELKKTEKEKDEESDRYTEDELLSDIYFDIHTRTNSKQKTKENETEYIGKKIPENCQRKKEEETLDKKILLDHIKRLEYQNNIFLNNLLNMYYASVDYIKMQDDKIKERDRIIHYQNEIINQLKNKKGPHNNFSRYEK